MKSSSNLFPVTLLRAEQYDDINEDVYLLKHNRDDDKSVQIALTHLSFAQDESNGEGRMPVVLNHGSFSNRSFWFSNKGIGLARYLLDTGFDVWMLEQRGHGFSPRNDAYYQNDSEHYVEYDFCAANDFIIEQTDKKPVWIGHSLGGVLIASAVACGVFDDKNCLGAGLIGAQPLLKRWYAWIPFVSIFMQLTTAVRKELNGRSLNIGPENEPQGIINEYLKRQQIFTRWRFNRKKQNLLPLWQGKHNIPLLSVAGRKDKPHPVKLCKKFSNYYGGSHKTFIELSRKHGFIKDYGHVDMIVSKEAAEEVWPAIVDWLNQLEHSNNTN